MMKIEGKGMLAPFTIITSGITGVFFPLLGSLIALDLNVIEEPYIEGIILVMLGGFVAHWMLAHTIHDLFHIEIEPRKTMSKKSLKIFLIISVVVLLSIVIYLTVYRGWPVSVFAAIGAIVCMYAKGLFHHESQMAFGAMFLVIGSFYVQAGTLDLDSIIWVKVLCIGMFSFLSQYGWLLFYRLDDYNWSKKIKNRSIIVAKSGLLFLILYFLL